MTPQGALTWLEDEIRFLDDGFRFWITSDRKFEIQTVATGKSFEIPTGKAVSLVQSQGGPAAARELAGKAREKTGGTPSPPKGKYTLPGYAPDMIKHQKLCYPKLWASHVVSTRQTDHAGRASQLSPKDGDQDSEENQNNIEHCPTHRNSQPQSVIN